MAQWYIHTRDSKTVSNVCTFLLRPLLYNSTEVSMRYLSVYFTVVIYSCSVETNTNISTKSRMRSEYILYLSWDEARGDRPPRLPGTARATWAGLRADGRGVRYGAGSPSVTVKGEPGRWMPWRVSDIT